MDILLQELICEGKQYWKTPSFQSEESAFLRIAEDMGLDYKKLKESFKKGNLSMLTDKKWDKLQNTDSTKPVTFHDITTKIQKETKRDPEYHKDINGIRAAYDSGKPVNAPIIMFYEGDYHLVSGNTRLMLAKAYRLTEKMKNKPWAYIFRHAE